MKKKILLMTTTIGLLALGLYEIGIFSQSINSNLVQAINYPRIMTAGNLLPKTGFLSKSGTMVILKVSDNYIRTLYPLLNEYLTQDEKRCLRPSPLHTGGHITLFKSPKLWTVPIGTYDFTPNGIVKEIVIKKKRHLTIHETWYEVSVSSPELDRSFSDLINPNHLHISIAVSKYIEGTHFCLYSFSAKYML